MANISMMQMLQGYLHLTAQRQQTIASNMANVDTPGYHTEDIDFGAALRNVMNDPGDRDINSVSVEVEGLPERPDGNNVNIDRESLSLSQTQLQYQLGVQLIRAEFHKLYSAIKETS
jgi:flagellar basal-body rod protein FlgB